MSWSLTAEADEDLANIYVSSVLAFGWDQAERYQDELEARFALIAANPGIGRRQPGNRVTTGRVFPVKSHVIVYRQHGDDVVILRIFHHREDWIAYFE